MRILVVDAEKETRDDLAAKLGRRFPGSSIVSFGNSLEVLKFTANNKFDLLFTDVRIQPFDGYEMIRILRQQNQLFCTYVVSGTKNKPDDLRWMDVNGCFAKPVTENELAQVENALVYPE